MTFFNRIWLTILVLICLIVLTTTARTVLPQHGSAPIRTLEKSQVLEASHGRPLATELDSHISTYPNQDPSPTPTPTPTPSPTPTPDPEIEKANKEKTLAEAKKASEEAKKAAADAETAAIAARLAAARAKLGLGPTDTAPTATAPSGNTTAGEAAQFMETQILAETAGRHASLELVKHLCGLEKSAPVPALTAEPMRTLIINNANDKIGVSQYRNTVAQLNLLHDHYLKLIKQSEDERDDTKVNFAAVPLLIPAATQLVKNVADLINLFRTETQISSQTVTVDSRFIVSNLANTLLATDNAQCKVKAIYHPAVYPLTVPKGAKSALFDAYKQLLDDVIAGDREVSANAKKVVELTTEKAESESAITKLQEQIAEAKKKAEAKKHPAKPSKKPGKQTETEPPFDIAKAENEIMQRRAFIDENLDPRIKRLQQAAEALTTFKDSLKKIFEILTAVDDATKQPIFNNLVSAERLSDLLADKATYVLTLNVKATGTNRTRKRIVLNTKLDHSGGATVDANLFNNLDQLVFGKVESFYIEFTGSKEIRERSGFQRLDKIER
ncbi:MAG TPA: hypothetical protein VN956_27560 [Pyrinomonadaceae bacterium]|nr:hypothetical protein [Pyrinomonadaceae bacterium]